MAGTQNPSGGGNGTPTTEGLDEGKRKKYGDHLVYSAELNYFAELIYTGKLGKRISFRWPCFVAIGSYFILSFVMAVLFACPSIPSILHIGLSFSICLLFFILFLGLRILDFLRDLTSLDNVKELYLKAKLSENKADFYLDQAHKTLGYFFTFLTASSAAILAVSGLYFGTLYTMINGPLDTISTITEWWQEYMPFLLLVISMNGLFISMLFASTMKHFFLVKALKLIVANQP